MCCIVLYYVLQILYCIVLCCVILYYTVLYFTVLNETRDKTGNPIAPKILQTDRSLNIEGVTIFDREMRSERGHMGKGGELSLNRKGGETVSEQKRWTKV